jgi:hypothetical protein
LREERMMGAVIIIKKKIKLTLGLNELEVTERLKKYIPLKISIKFVNSPLKKQKITKNVC